MSNKLFFEGDKDDFAAMKRMAEKFISSKQPAFEVAIHNFCDMSGEKSQPLVYLMCPTPNKSYSGTHLLKIWSKAREVCAANNVNLIGRLSRFFSLSIGAAHDTDRSAVAEGINYLGLGVPDKKFLSPYFWRLPAIAYGDYDHLRRTFLRVLNYDTRNLILYKDSCCSHNQSPSWAHAHMWPDRSKFTVFSQRSSRNKFVWSATRHGL